MKIIVIGCGSIGQRHIKNLLHLKAGEILAFDIDRKRINELKAISRSIKASCDLNKLWKEKPGIAFITVPTALHVKYAVEAAKRGCHLFIEKPLSHNMKGLDRLIELVSRKKLVAFVGYNYRFDSCLVKIKRLLKDSIAGKLIAGKIHFGSYLPDRHPQRDYRSDYGGKDPLGGGVVLDVLSHHLDLLIFLLGKPTAIYAYGRKASNLDIDVEDTAEVIARFSGGAVVNLHANFIQRPYKHTLELIGDAGTIFYDFVKGVLRYYRTDKKKWVTFRGERDHNNIYIKEIKYFLRCVRKKATPPVDVISAKEEQAILMKMKDFVSI